MSANDPAQLERRLAGLLPDEPEVRISGLASLGAQRRTLFLEIGSGHETRKAVAQIASQTLQATSVEAEAGLLRAALRAGVPVPGLLAVDGELGAIVCEHIEGETIPRRILRQIEARPELRKALTRDCGRALAAIHRIPHADLSGLPDLSTPGRYADELEGLLDGLTSPHPTFRLGLRWLRRKASTLERATTCVVHGDFRLGNIIADERGLASVLDWELAHLGDPMEDLAWLCLRTWRFGADEYEVGGFGQIEWLRESYLEAGGEWRQEAFAWWTVARTLWWGLGLARQVQAFLEGAADSIVLAASGRRVAELEYDLLRSIEDRT